MRALGTSFTFFPHEKSADQEQAGVRGLKQAELLRHEFAGDAPELGQTGNTAPRCIGENTYC